MVSLLETGKRILSRSTHRIHSLPVVVLMPHSRCNCRCVMCDIWKANENKRELSADALRPHVESLAGFGVRSVTLSGGEALMHSNLWSLCELIRDRLGARISLLSTGLTLAKHSADVVRWCDDVIVSLDGSEAVHDEIRAVPRAFARLAEGVAALKSRRADFPVTARTVVQRRNHTDLPGIVSAARGMDLDSVSFLAADVSTAAFNRPEGWTPERVSDVALSAAESEALGAAIDSLIEREGAAIDAGFIVESRDGLRRIAAYYAALVNQSAPPAVSCNAPWVSAVIEADGAVRPCFFHPALGHLDDGPLAVILNSERAVDFRRRLDVPTDPTCSKCVCSLNIHPRTEV